MKIRILIVEDEMLLATTYEMGLQASGVCEPAGIAFTGEGAVEEAEKTRPDAVLMDIRLKGRMNGIEAARLIMSRMNIPVIYISGNADANTRKLAMETNPKGFFNKPVEPELLCGMISEALFAA